jgi:hypothetical protein
MSNVLTEWRQAVAAQLAANLQDGTFTVLAGERDGLSRDRKLACVFAPAVQTDGSNVSFARPVLTVRAWVPIPKTPAPTEPRDPEPVEQLMIDLAQCLQQIQTPALPSAIFGFYFFVTQIRPDYEDFGVEATLQGWTGNPAVLPEG